MRTFRRLNVPRRQALPAYGRSWWLTTLGGPGGFTVAVGSFLVEPMGAYVGPCPGVSLRTAEQAAAWGHGRLTG